MYLNQHEIQSLLITSFDNFIDFVNTLPDNRFTASPYGKWSAGQQLEHLTKSARPVSGALGFPKITLRYFGVSQRPSRSYDTLVEHYLQLLTAGGKSTKAYLPGVVYTAQRPALVQGFLAQKDKLSEKMMEWSENDLDKYRLPHPLLGKLTIREMLYFTAYHNQHHLERLKDQELQGHTWQNQLQQLIF
ncbi:DinB family protein [Chitinophaga nivalis]|uniref:DinB family protein n=1 Tax=Chitinophaga nivalis TaxID=2991709 RepID=A0ABT3ISL3_9BACT|nr:DinB family protein [Chitinophaga nivalis]MCW3463338.1 DinB family protein [Chitinophaga nivalis]MCW3486972.1 DinB family protein [Chitinophaga nivalis]